METSDATSGQAIRGTEVCVIGAGPAGLTVAKNLTQRGIDYECLEKESDIGGVWNPQTSHGRVHAATNMISSKRMTEYVDFRMPREYPHYPRHDQALAYLRAYADENRLTERIRFNTGVVRIENREGGYCVHTEDGQAKIYSNVIIASGHHRREIMPNWASQYSGEMIHSSEYKDATRLKDKRVLVIGGGNSGCDIAVESAQHAKTTTMSWRRAYHVLPKFLFGAPLDRCGDTMDRWRVPRWLIERIMRACLRIAVGPLSRYGLPKPDHGIFQCHPIVNSQLLHFLGHRRIEMKPNVDSAEGAAVLFSDGTREEFDLVICATGYEIDFSLLKEPTLAWNGNESAMFLNVFPPHHDNLFVAGLIQPNGGIWQLVDYQAQLISRFIDSARRGSGGAEWFRNRKQKRSNADGRYLDTPRHAVEVDYYRYKRSVRKLIAEFDRRDGRS